MTPGDPRITVTSTEAPARKHLVQPYADDPVVERKRWIAACTYCGNPGFRRSRLRLVDGLQFLLLRYPVRCTRCGQRQHAFLWTALRAFPPRADVS